MVRGLEPTEHDLQVAFFDIIRRHRKRYPALNLCFAVPNSQKLLSQARNKFAFLRHMKNEGLEDGVLDIILLAPSGKYHGLLMEMKRNKRLCLTPAQLRFQSYAIMFGYQCHAVSDPEKAWELVKDYLGIS